jgi:hypothetical protein
MRDAASCRRPKGLRKGFARVRQSGIAPVEGRQLQRGDPRRSGALRRGLQATKRGPSSSSSRTISAFAPTGGGCEIVIRCCSVLVRISGMTIGTCRDSFRVFCLRTRFCEHSVGQLSLSLLRGPNQCRPLSTSSCRAAGRQVGLSVIVPSGACGSRGPCRPASRSTPARNVELDLVLLEASRSERSRLGLCQFPMRLPPQMDRPLDMFFSLARSSSASFLFMMRA